MSSNYYKIETKRRIYWKLSSEGRWLTRFVIIKLLINMSTNFTIFIIDIGLHSKKWWELEIKVLL